jgi:thiol-disulfide isomerase/thioredoxin
MFKVLSKWMLAMTLAMGWAAVSSAPAPSPASLAITALAAADFQLSAEATKPRPKLDIDTLDGNSFQLASLRGQWVVVNFWATWCPPCIKEMPELSALDAEREDVSVVGLAFEEIDKDELKAFLKQHPVVYPIALVDVYNPPADFDTPRGLPLTYLIAPDGSIAEKIMGPVTRAELEKMIAEKKP